MDNSINQSRFQNSINWHFSAPTFWSPLILWTQNPRTFCSKRNQGRRKLQTCFSQGLPSLNENHPEPSEMSYFEVTGDLLQCWINCTCLTLTHSLRSPWNTNLSNLSTNCSMQFQAFQLPVLRWKGCSVLLDAL